MSYNEYSEQEVIRVINYIGINLPDKSDPDGNVTIKSPLREDRNPSFSINVEKDGVWYDHGNGLSGNLASIIVNYYRVNATQAYNFIQDILADEYPNIRHYDFKGRRIRAKWKEKSDKKPDKTQDKKASNSIQSVGNDKEEDQKNNQQLKFNPEEAKSRLDKEDHQLIETVKSYDLLSKETLQIFDCGIFSQTYNDWLSIPYETGVQLYRRNGGEKSVRMIKGSKPKESWFGVEQLEKRGTLIISKSPRETMLIKQEYGDLVDIISIASGETGALSNAQAIALRKMVTPYKIVKVIFDCDTDSAHKIAMEFTEAVQKQIGKRALRYINIHELTNGECKDVNDLLKNYESDWVLKNVLVKGSSLDGNSRITVNDLISRDISVDDAPRYPDEIYEILPSALRGMMDLMSEGYKKDVFLTSALPVIAAHLPNVKIPHNDGAYSPDYFSILIANPGSGKGVADKAKKLGEELNAHLIQESEEEQAKWEQLSKEERELKRRPKSKKLFLPGNSSSRAVYEALAFNDGRGLIFETEIDSLVNASNQEWGDYSDLLRKTFHHESISLSRKEFDLTISKPELSIFMSGTFDQFRAMFPSAENGYYSRFAFYTFKAPVRWHSHRPSKRSMELGERIKRNSKRLFHIHQHISLFHLH